MLKTKLDSSFENDRESKKFKEFKELPIECPIPYLPYEVYHIIARYYSKKFKEQMDFLQAISKAHEFEFTSVIKYFNLNDTEITDEEWLSYKSLLVNTPRHLIITNYSSIVYSILDTTPQLHTLEFGEEFDHPVNKLLVLPPNLHTLRFGYSFDQPVNKLELPQSLHTLKFGYKFDQPVEKLVLPQSLHTLIFGYSFDQPVEKLVLPQSLHTLEFLIFDEDEKEFKVEEEDFNQQDATSRRACDVFEFNLHKN